MLEGEEWLGMRAIHEEGRCVEECHTQLLNNAYRNKTSIFLKYDITEGRVVKVESICSGAENVAVINAHNASYSQFWE